MSFAAAAVLVALAIAVGVPAVVLGLAVLRGGRPNWLPLRGRRRVDPNIHAFLMSSVLAVLALAVVFALPLGVAIGGLDHGFTAVEGAFLAVLALAGLGYAWRRGVLRWQ